MNSGGQKGKLQDLTSSQEFGKTDLPQPARVENFDERLLK